MFPCLTTLHTIGINTTSPCDVNLTPQTYGYRGCRMKAALTTFKIGFSTETTTQPDNRKSLGSAFEPGSHYELRPLYTVPSLLPVTNLNVLCLRLFKF